MESDEGIKSFKVGRKHEMTEQERRSVRKRKQQYRSKRGGK